MDGARRGNASRGVAAAALVVAFLVPAPASAAGPLREYVGPIHEHTAYSDGQPGTRPADAFARVRSLGNDYVGLTEHSDTNELPITTSTDCLGPDIADCALADRQEPRNSSSRR